MAAAYTPAGFCPACGYRLDPGRCPECGRQVDRPLRSHPRRRRLVRRIVLAAVAAAALAGVVAVYQYSFEIGRYVVPRPVLLAVSSGDHAVAKWARNALYAQYYDRAAIEWPKAEERERQIDAELSEPNLPEWAGQYGAMQRNPFAATEPVIKVAPRNGFTCRWPYRDAGVDHGRIACADSTRILLDAVLKREDYTQDVPWPREYHRVVYQGQVYLIAAKHMLLFCNMINAGESIDYPDFMPQWNPRAAPPPGTTRLPAPFNAYVLRAPIDASVESAGEAYAAGAGRRLWVRLDAGSDRDVFCGMALYDELGCLVVTVVAVAPAWCKAEMGYAIDGCWRRPAVGERFCSRPSCANARLSRQLPTVGLDAPSPPTSSGPSP